MKTVLAPPAPSWSASDSTEQSAPRVQSPLDAAFLGRVYRSMLWFGLAMTALAAFRFQTAPALGSFVGGLVLAALLLRVQEVSVRTLLRPHEQLGGFDAKLLMALLLPFKFGGIIALLWGANALGYLLPGPLALGFFAGQMVIVAKVAGWLLARSARRK